MNHAFHFRLTYGQTEFRLHISANATWNLLHRAIMILFSWQDNGWYRFSFLDREITEGRRAEQAVSLWLQEHTAFQYTYFHNDKKEQIHIEANAIYTNPCGFQLIDSPRRNGDFHQLQQQLDALTTEIKPDSRIAALLERIRADLLTRKTIAPYLIQSQRDGRCAWFYLDVLDNGMELMIFADESDFTRSIVNSTNEDPDLLFTNSYTFDFLYDDIDHCELPLYHHHNLSFKNVPGKLPRALNTEEQQQVVLLLEDFYALLRQTKQLPSLGDQQMLRSVDGSVSVVAYQPLPAAVHPTTQKQHDIPTYPHTNERIHLMLQAVPHHHEMIVRLTAMNDHFTKAVTVHMHPISTLQCEIDEFLMQLFKERGIAEAFILHSLNLQQMIAPICERLGIVCFGYHQPNGADLFMADLLSKALPLSGEDLYPHQNPYRTATDKLLN